MYRGMRECAKDGGSAAQEKRRATEQRIPVARSTFMKAEEIAREREQSGWNPYAGEEELPGKAALAEDDMSQEESGLQQMGEPWEIGRFQETSEPRETDGLQPYFMTPDYAKVQEEQREAERELRRLQSMYPDAAKLLLPYVEEECDKMEYEGSPMFDEYPDRTTIYRLEEHIYEQVKGQFPEEETQETQEMREALSMQSRAPRIGGSGSSLARDLARVLLLNEMYHRRCRYHGCRRF